MAFSRWLTALVTLVVACSTTGNAQISLTDDLQRQVTLSRPASRIVSLAPSITESLFAIGAGAQVVGVTDYCDYPPEARSCRRVGGMINPSIEAIVGLSPDLIIVSMEGNQRQDFVALTGLRIPVFACNPRSLEGINRTLRQFGSLTGHLREAMRLADSLTKRAAQLRVPGTIRHIPTLLLVSVQPLMAVGSKTFLDELLTDAGGNNLAASTGLTYPSLSREMVLTADPEVLLITTDAFDSTTSVTSLYPEWARLSAVRSGRVYRVDADLVTRPGPRSVEGLALLKSHLRTGRP
jgi:iron complex transport system substrate-binding protein